MRVKSRNSGGAVAPASAAAQQTGSLVGLSNPLSISSTLLRGTLSFGNQEEDSAAGAGSNLGQGGSQQDGGGGAEDSIQQQQGATGSDEGPPQLMSSGEEEEEDAGIGGSSSRIRQGTLWRLARKEHIAMGSKAVRGQKGITRFCVPHGLLSTWFPHTSLPLDVSLQLEVDGVSWGPRFDSVVSRRSMLTKGLSLFEELEGCRLVAFRRGPGVAPALDIVLSSFEERKGGPSVQDSGAAAVAQRRHTVTRPLEPEDLEEDVWPTNLNVTNNVFKRRLLPAPSTLLNTWWPGAATPLRLNARVVLDGVRKPGALEMELRNSTKWYRFLLPKPCPLPLDSTVVRLKKAAGERAIELHVRCPVPPDATATVAAAAPGAAATVPAPAAAEPRPAAAPLGLAGGSAPDAVAVAEAVAEAVADADPRPPPRKIRRVGPGDAGRQAGGVEADGSPTAGQAQEQPHQPSRQGASGSGTRAVSAAAASGSLPTKTRAAAGGGAGSARGTRARARAVAGADGADQTAATAPPLAPVADAAAAPPSSLPAALSARLAALALQDIPPLGEEATDRALAAALSTAFREIERAADTLQLPTAVFDAVCGAVEALAEAAPRDSMLFVGLRYRRLRAACAAGDAAAALAWMERLAAGGGV